MSPARKILLAVLAVGIVATAALLWARRVPGDDLIVRKVLIDVDPAAVAGSVDREQVRLVVDDVLASARGVTMSENADGVVVRVRVESFSTSTAPDPSAMPADHPAVTTTTSLALLVEVIDHNRPGGRGHSVATAQGVMSPDALIGQALRDAIRQIQQARAADDLDSDTLLAWVTDGSTSDSQRRRAMQALASRRERRATPAMVALLQSTDDAMATAALQALTVLGDPDAVDAIIDYSSRQPALVRKMCIDAVRASASPRGIPWLFTLSSGHPDEDVQAAARAALAQLAPDMGKPEHAADAPAGG